MCAPLHIALALPAMVAIFTSTNPFCCGVFLAVNSAWKDSSQSESFALSKNFLFSPELSILIFSTFRPLFSKLVMYLQKSSMSLFLFL